MATPGFRFVCSPSALSGAPSGWAQDMLEGGEIALLPDAGGIEAISATAHELGLLSAAVVRSEETPERQQQTVIDYAQALPLVWVGSEFTPQVRGWAQARGPMTLLVESAGALPDEERKRIDRFVAILGRQSE